MDGETIYLLFVCFLIVALLILVCVFGAKSEKKHKKEHPEIDERTIFDYESKDVHVKVIDLSCAVLSEGHRQPRTFNEFLVTFETDEGQILKFRVDEEMYNGFEKGQLGILTVTDSTIYGFVLD